MFKFISSLYQFLQNFLGFKILTTFFLIAVIFFSCIIARYAAKKVLLLVAGRLSANSSRQWAVVLFRHKAFTQIANLSIPIVLSLYSSGILQTAFEFTLILVRAQELSLVIVLIQLIHVMIAAFNDIYSGFKISKQRPLKGVLQVAETVIIIVGGITCVAVLAGQNPFALIGGIGAAAAVFSFIFKDAILGFVAGIQLSIGDMVRIGDWIEIPGKSANGTVADISMTTVKIENFDKSFSLIPVSSLMAGEFMNWRDMQSADTRRIKNSILVDSADVKFCSDEMIERLKKIQLLEDYIVARQAEIDHYNKEGGYNLDDPANGRRMTNLGSFRAYMLAYLRNNPAIRQDMSVMVRQLAAADRGIPLEIYAFTASADWAQFETTKSDILDHVYAVIAQFDLAIYQAPSGEDIKKLKIALQ